MPLAHLEQRHPDRASRATYAFVGSGLAMVALASLALALHAPYIFPSLGASAYALFGAPQGPISAPRNVLLGHFLGIACGFAALALFGLTDAPPTFVEGVSVARVAAAGLSVAATCALMLLLDAGHPPAGASALIVSLGIISKPSQLLIMMVSVALLVGLAVVFHRASGVLYPRWSTHRE